MVDSDRKDNYPLMSPFDISSASISDAFPDIPPNPKSEPFPTILLIISAIVIAVVGLDLLVYFKKRHKTESA